MGCVGGFLFRTRENHTDKQDLQAPVAAAAIAREETGIEAAGAAGRATLTKLSILLEGNWTSM